jgi:Flp pilus assembly protein TadD/outer membrane protein OmpA-like peptidoglycan-associated protein
MKKAYSLFTKALIFSILTALPLTFIAQEAGDANVEKKEKKSSSFSPFWFIGGEIGPTWSHADLSRYDFAPDFGHTNINGAIGFGRQLSPIFSAYGDFERGFFEGEKKNVATTTVADAKYGRDMRFNTDYYGGNLNLGINISNLVSGYHDRLIDFEVHLGVGQTQWKSTTYDLTTDAVIGSNGKKDVKSGGTGSGISDRNIDLTVPVGFNVNFNVSDNWDIYGDYAYTWMETDYADGVVHGSLEVKNDVYSHFNIGARYKFGGNDTKKMASNFEKVELTATPDPLESRGDSVEVTIKGVFPPKYFGKKAVMCFAPVLTYEGGQTTFPPMVFKGEDVAGDGTLVNHSNGGAFTYTGKIPYDPAMNIAELEVAPVIYTYNGESYESCEAAQNAKGAVMAPARKMADGTIHTSNYYRDSEVLAWAPHAYEKETISTQKSDLFFQVNLAQLNWKLPLNKKDENYNALENNLSDVEKGWVIKDVTINGWASPEGEETFNAGLSQRRAETAQKYMDKKFKKAAKSNKSIDPANINYVVKSNGPDWNGFMKAVQSSTIQDKSAILNVINSADQSKKEEEIRNMILIYPEIERDILPPLRRANINVNTYMPKKTDEQIAQLSTTDPKSLDMEELFYAATLTDDNGNKRLIYGSIIEFYPKCWRSVNNAAAVELAEGNLEIAKDLLMKAVEMNENSYEVRNNMGAYHMMTGDYMAAEKCYTKAQSLGGDENYNLGIVNIAKGDYAKAEMLLKGANCDFNKGLAQLLNGNNAGAESTFKCAPQDAETMYLLAITYARTDNKSMMLDYLGKSIKADPEVAKLAATDREFLKYYNEPDFQALVNMK